MRRFDFWSPALQEKAWRGDGELLSVWSSIPRGFILPESIGDVFVNDPQNPEDQRVAILIQSPEHFEWIKARFYQ